jgi:protein SFI1
LERRAQRAFEATVKAKALIQWRSVMWAHAKQVKQAKLVRRLFLTRLAWKRWRDVVEARRWEQSKVKMERKVLKRALDAWREGARIQRGLRRKGEVVRMANEAVSDARLCGVKCVLTLIVQRLVKEALQAWTLRVVYLKDREYSVIQENRERVLRFVPP